MGGEATHKDEIYPGEKTPIGLWEHPLIERL
jgi:hypothetical protein